MMASSGERTARVRNSVESVEPPKQQQQQHQQHQQKQQQQPSGKMLLQPTVASQNPQQAAAVAAGRVLLSHYRALKRKAEQSGASETTSSLRAKIVELEDALAGVTLDADSFATELESTQVERDDLKRTLENSA
jgi:hypothetical protein